MYLKLTTPSYKHTRSTISLDRGGGWYYQSLDYPPNPATKGKEFYAKQTKVACSRPNLTSQFTRVQCIQSHCSACTSLACPGSACLLSLYVQDKTWAEFSTLDISVHVPYFIKYSAHFFTLKMILKYSPLTIHRGQLRKGLRWLL